MGRIWKSSGKHASAIKVKHSWHRRMIVGAAAIAVTAIAAIIVASSIYAPNIAEAIVSVVTLLIAVYGLYLLDRRMKATEQQTQAMAEQTANTAKQIEESRFAKAFEQIGDKSVVIQLGGLNLLDIIAKEGEEEYQRVWGYLASFLCHPPPLSDSQDDNPEGLRPGVAEIAKMLRQAHDRYPDHNAQLLNLSGANLKGVNLSGANLKGVNLSGANLKGVNLFRANLRVARLRWVQLERANLFGVQLGGVNLFKANLKGANLQAASFRETNVSNCDFSQVKNLTAEQLQGMVWIEGQQAPKLPDDLSHQTIRCITEEEWEALQKGYSHQDNQSKF